MKTSRKLSLLAFAAVLLFGSLAAACSGDDAAAATLHIEVQLTSQEKVLHEAGDANQIVFGWNRLTGSAEVNGEQVEVEMLGNVNYVEGSGDFFGFVTLTFADGSTLGTLMPDGKAAASTDTSDATFSSDLEVIGGSGEYVAATGEGTFEGARKDALGGAVDSVFEFNLTLP